MSDVHKIQKSNIAQREEEVLAFWNERNIFEKSVEKEAPNGDYVFYDGPPFATGTPHYGHLLQSAVKDAVPRYWTMKGYRIPRQWGWDCHGLPIENIVEKELGTKSKRDVIELGVKKFNDLCRQKIFTYADVWDVFIPRFGRWADMANPYRTMDKDYMESEWWAFKTLYDNGLIYEDYRTMHICPRCETTLAQSEVAEGYADIKDLAVTVEFPVVGEENTAFLAWTTTPWTLPGNVALAVGGDIEYVTIEKKDEGVGEIVRFILAKEALERVFGDDEYTIIETRKGSELVGMAYTPPFDSYVNDESISNRENAWKVYSADFVTTDTGTGIAHEAPAFGAEDMELAQEVGLPLIQHVGMDGVIKDEVTELAGLSVKPVDDHQATDIEVVKYLAGKNILFAKEKYEHSYPHCWRCDTPLINYATSSWFVAVEKIKQDLLKYAEEISWSPTHMKGGRWGEWLKGARDWSISRQRFWANTIPVWRCLRCKTDRVFGSVAELEEASGNNVDDLHKDVVDEVVVPCTCGEEMRRVPDVLDTWFNSGSVPFATHHYPFENDSIVDTHIPADFIGEAQDQVSKWFYYQHVLSGALFKKHAFKQVVTTGIVLAEDGKKMSKRLQNYPDPQDLVDTHGADAVRLYILGSPVVRAENLNFSESGVAEISRKVFGRLVNMYELYDLYKDDIDHGSEPIAGNVLDEWIVARLNEVHGEVTHAMDAYELDRATRPFADLVDDFSTWYIRRSRDRFKGSDEDDKRRALATTRFALRKIAKMMAPFAPFHADWLWQRVKRDDDEESVHLARWCSVKNADPDLLHAMLYARSFVEMGLRQRAEAKIKVRQPLRRLIIKHGFDAPPRWEEVISEIKEELNVEEVILKAGEEGDAPGVLLDTELDDELREKGHLRELIRAVQSARKAGGLHPGESARATLHAPQETRDLAKKYADDVAKATQVTLEGGNDAPDTSVILL